VMVKSRQVLYPFLTSLSSIWGADARKRAEWAWCSWSTDWSVCLLALKHLVSLQARVRPSVQTEWDLHTADRWEERDRKKKKMLYLFP
jgi:hypothetical protein